jgi:hypothetical protein
MFLTVVIAILHINQLLSPLQGNRNNVVDFFKYNIPSPTLFSHLYLFLPTNKIWLRVSTVSYLCAHRKKNQWLPYHEIPV